MLLYQLDDHLTQGLIQSLREVRLRRRTTKLTGRGRLQNLGVAENQYGGPGQVQRLVRRRPHLQCLHTAKGRV